MLESEVDPRKTAVALRYKPVEDVAPKVVAKGRGLIAERIITIAEEYGIPIHEDPSLVEVLVKLDMGMEIPPELYRVVAEILAFVYRMDQHWKQDRGIE
ncbi:MAG: EscU/YscU/HrcU family type III secretion system export apparatus switch protein [Candidatus Latescibacteria bacterium]|nr:EscU/YscU/HrcU family type III secretion system export apparatus switch protein [Candidatus Latescibacterota bacterium]